MEGQIQPRQIAIRASASDVTQGEFIDKRYDRKIISPHGVEMKRVALVGFVVSKFLKDAEGEKKRFESVTIDDGTDTIQLKVFGQQMFKDVKEGALVLVVGRVSKGRDSDDVFINPDFIKELTDPNLMSLHLLERYRTILRRTGLQLPDTSKYQQMTLESVGDDTDDSGSDDIEEESPPKKPKRKKSTRPKIGGLAGDILAYIEKNVNPDGVSMKDIVAHFEKKGKKSKDIQTKVFDLTGDDVIYEVTASHYLPSDM